MMVRAKNLISTVLILLFSFSGEVSSNAIKTEEILNAKLSPSGKYLAIVKKRGTRGRYRYKKELTVLETSTNEQVFYRKIKDPYTIPFYQIHWVDDQQIAFTNVIAYEYKKRAELKLVDVTNGKTRLIYGKVRELDGGIDSDGDFYTKNSETLLPIIANSSASNGNVLLVYFADFSKKEWLRLPTTRPVVTHIDLNNNEQVEITQLPKRDLVLFADENANPALATNGQESFWFNIEENRWQPIGLSMTQQTDVRAVTRHNNLITYSLLDEQGQTSVFEYNVNTEEERQVDLKTNIANRIYILKHTGVVAVRNHDVDAKDSIQLVGEPTDEKRSFVDTLEDLTVTAQGKPFQLNSYSDRFETLLVSFEGSKATHDIYLYNTETAQLNMIGPIKK